MVHVLARLACASSLSRNLTFLSAACRVAASADDTAASLDHERVFRILKVVEAIGYRLRVIPLGASPLQASIAHLVRLLIVFTERCIQPKREACRERECEGRRGVRSKRPPATLSCLWYDTQPLAQSHEVACAPHQTHNEVISLR